MNERAIKDVLIRALHDLVNEDSYLLDISASERSICHRLAVHLSSQAEFREFNVDCEFNRDGDVPKAFGIGRGRRRIFPDIIVHKRGPRGPNLLVLEMKIGSSRTARDEEKVRSYVNEFGYKVGLSVVVPRRARGTFKLKWYARSGSASENWTYTE